MGATCRNALTHRHCNVHILMCTLTSRRCCGSATSCSSSTPATTSTLVFANAGIGGVGSFVNDSREEWERTFAV